VSAPVQPSPRRHDFGRGVSLAFAVTILGVAPLLVTGAPSASARSAKPSVINAIGAESEYADVLSQIGGQYVQVSSILNNPNTDPHTYEASPSVAQEVSHAALIVQNGVGYDSFMDHMESASPNPKRKVIVVQHVLGLPDGTPNPHLWYDPKTMPAVARVMAADLADVAPGHKAYFQTRLTVFDTSLQPLTRAIAAFKDQHAGTPVATTEPVADYLLSAMGLRNLTPFTFQSDIMNGVDPAPQDITLENGFFTKHLVKVFCYNEQVVDSLTRTIRENAQGAHVPIVGVYETMPTPGYDYQSWMLAEVKAIRDGVLHGTSTSHL